MIGEEGKFDILRKSKKTNFTFDFEWPTGGNGGAIWKKINTVGQTVNYIESSLLCREIITIFKEDYRSTSHFVCCIKNRASVAVTDETRLMYCRLWKPVACPEE